MIAINLLLCLEITQILSGKLWKKGAGGLKFNQFTHCLISSGSQFQLV